MTQIKRVWLEIILFLCLMILFFSNAYSHIPAPIQLAALKMLLTNAGFLHAHVLRKLVWTEIVWDEPLKAKHYVAIAIYITFPVCYAFGG
ncbi:hypothetical protein [Sulfurimonas sp. HSL-1716]|uniref:hypothetical protein n=1 Tax=Hydrocurvibacter sulfurireducens TaxID=3131937 RepID=UPI0031F9D2AD